MRVGGQERGGGDWITKGRLYPLLGLFGVAMSPRSARHRARHA